MSATGRRDAGERICHMSTVIGAIAPPPIDSGAGIADASVVPPAVALGTFLDAREPPAAALLLFFFFFFFFAPAAAVVLSAAATRGVMGFSNFDVTHGLLVASGFDRLFVG
jgi:hypothetical protein